MSPGEVEESPDFGWPDTVTEFVVEWLNRLWEGLKDYAAEQLRHRTFVCWASGLTISAGIAYLAALWVCFCYIRFPVSPYGVWEITEWAMVAGAVVWGAIGVYFGAALLLWLFGLMLLVAVYFTLSLGYLCWTLWTAHRRQSPWLKRYRVVIIFGIAAVLATATFVDGAYRLWDAPFRAFAWLKLAFVGGSAWTALFCYLIRDKVALAEIPRTIITWTVVSALAIGTFVHWQADRDRSEYFMWKNVTQHPNDPAAWLDLARHYEDQGDVLAGEAGDEDHQPADPRPYYEEALDSINRAIELGATGFEARFSRAKLADAIGENQAAVLYAQEALQNAPPEECDQVRWLREMMAMHNDALITSHETRHREEQSRRVRDRRRGRLPRIVRWAFDSTGD
jgi:tetratricopeptide (TPR) repeat protein